MRLLLRWVIDAVAVIAVLYLLPHIVLDSLVVALVIALVLGLANAAARPVFVVLSLPLNPATLGIFVLVINAALLELFQLVFGSFDLGGILWLAIATVVIAILTTVINVLVSDE